ncbi:MAG: recombinase family protein [Sphingopyxis sp.]|nr:recombinase family protein [Sphingopyxis sp.]
MKPLRKRCAIYTRKSSEEGLDQEFNSLDAQREAGEAYVKSQSSEGWVLLPDRYDDGGFSGGSMERPALKALLADVEAGLIDVIVVYKIDRLTRSLADFARMVELFDRQGVSFVSVTQSFNTTSSMGRLTLNVLLSFAQFEREVTGERIRDKIAASKAKGMWMGGTPPLGYDLPTDKSRALVVNDREAETVRHIFRSYIRLQSVHALERQLAAEGIVTKVQMRRDGSQRGGVPFSRGALFHLLRNRTYLGLIVHKDKQHQGAHEAIIDQRLFDKVQALLDAKARRSETKDTKTGRALLVGRLFDADGNPMSPSFSRGKSGRAYRYYVSAPLQQGARLDRGTPRRVSARVIDSFVADLAERFWPRDEQRLALIDRAELHCGSLHLLVSRKAGAMIARDHCADGDVIPEGQQVRVIVPMQLGASASQRNGLRDGGVRRDPSLIRALRKAHAMVGKDDDAMPLLIASPESPYDRRLVRLAFLAPEIQRDIIAGKQPSALTLQAFIRMDIPVCWREQRLALGWAETANPAR